MPCGTGRVCYNPCRPQVYGRCIPYCSEPAAAVASDGLRAQVGRLNAQVEVLQKQVAELEKKVDILEGKRKVGP
jgi:hypothetical protein